MDNNVLTIAGLTKYYGGGSAPALNNLYMNLQPGRIVGLLGPNGSGKTTLLKLIAGLLTTNVGTIQICGKPIGPESKALVSYLPDRTYLRNNQKIKDQLDFFQDFYGDFDRPRAEEMLRNLGISLEITALVNGEYTVAQYQEMFKQPVQDAITALLGE